jgi:hypothetical protein
VALVFTESPSRIESLDFYNMSHSRASVVDVSCIPLVHLLAMLLLLLCGAECASYTLSSSNFTLLPGILKRETSPAILLLEGKYSIDYTLSIERPCILQGQGSVMMKCAPSLLQSAIYISSGDVSLQGITISGCLRTAIVVNSTGNINISSCTLHSNAGTVGSAIAVFGSPTLLLKQSDFASSIYLLGSDVCSLPAPLSQEDNRNGLMASTASTLFVRISGGRVEVHGSVFSSNGVQSPCTNRSLVVASRFDTTIDAACQDEGTTAGCNIAFKEVVFSGNRCVVDYRIRV